MDFITAYNLPNFPPVTFLVLGFTLGLKHALEADHVLTVSTLVIPNKNFKASSFYGALWGLGHSLMLLVAAAAVLLLKLTIPQRLSGFFEIAVAVTLILLGLNTLRNISQRKIHRHQHTHDGVTHAHFHSHQSEGSHNHVHKTFALGMLHGLAGSGALMLLVVANAPSTAVGFWFVIIFGIGSTLSMLVISMLLTWSAQYFKKFQRLNFGVELFTASLSIIAGVVFLQHSGFGLF